MRKNFMKKVVAGMLTAVMAFSLTACGGGDASTNDTAKEEGSSDVITVGFSQVGAESDWRTANSESMKSTFTKDNGYELIFDDAQQKQENQISAIRNFIQQDVDYIVLAPVTETGWDAVLGEAKQAGIPVIIVDRMVDVKDDSLYTAWVGSNFELEGKKAAAYLDAYMKAKNMKDMKLVQEMLSPAFTIVPVSFCCNPSVVCAGVSPSPFKMSKTFPYNSKDCSSPKSASPKRRPSWFIARSISSTIAC